MRSPRNLGILGLVGATFLLLVVLALSGISALSTIRAYVVGNGLWTKAQKQSVNALHRFARTGSEVDWADFEACIDVIEGDRLAREELERPEPDMDLVMEGFERGQIPEEFREDMAILFRRARGVAFVGEAISLWEESDERIDELKTLAAQLREVRLAPEVDDARLQDVLARIEGLDQELTTLEEAFTVVLSDGATQLEGWLRWVLLGIAGVAFFGSGAALRYLYHQVQHREEVLERSERRYRALFEESVVGTMLVNEDGVINRANPAFATMLGYDSPDELMGQPSARLYSDPSEPERLLEALHENGALFVDELLMRRKDGSGVWLMTSSVLLESHDGRSEVLVTGIDITGRKEMEQRLARKGRMEAMGQLAGGIAHDFNNLLTAILGNASLLESELPGPGRQNASQILSEIVTSSGTAAELTEQLLAFSRGDPAAASHVDLSDLVRRTQSLLERLLPESIDLETALSDEAAVVRAPPAQLRQVLLNLVINARDAMPDGGRLGISVDHVTLGGDAIDGFVDLEPGQYVRLTVTDEGSGIEPEIRGRLFEPFFTTKPEGAGTGMGLATVYGVVTRAGGTVYVDSSADPGATFRVLLPRQEAPAAEGSASAEAGSNGGGGTILLVEDDDAVRRVARRILENAGYEVREAVNGVEALSMFEAGENFDLLLTDVVMPGMGGVELAGRIVEDRPEVPILFVSGYSKVALQSETLQSATTDSLAKPFTPVALVERVKALLEASGRRVGF